MAAVVEGQLPYRILAEESSTSNPTNAVIFFGISLVLGIACRHLLNGTRVPYTVALLVLGIGLGSLEYGTSHRLGKIGDGIRLWASIDPDLLLAVFLPALLFESSFSMEVHQIKKCMVQMVLLAGPGVLISTFCLGTALKLTFPYNWSWKISLLLGGLLSATDPVAVVALLKELGASKKLNTIIEGESLMNDGTAIVVYQLFYRMVTGQSFNCGEIIGFLTKVCLGAVGIGVALGIASVLWLGFIFNDTVIEITLTLAVSYIAFFTAQEGADVSGVLAVMTLGMFFSAFARTAFKRDGQESLHHFWEMVAYIANTLIFILSGVVIAEGVLSSDSIFKSHENSWGYLFLLYVFVQVSRIVVVGVLYPFLRYFGYGLDWKEATILVWAGLRGAVALSLSLSVKRSSDYSSYISSEAGTLFVFFTGGIVFLTLIVNGSTTQFILHVLNMDKLSATKRRILDYTKYEMWNKALEAFGDLGDDEELGPVDWPTVKRYISSLNDVEGEHVHPHTVTADDNNLDHMNLKDMRIRFLNGVQAAYWGMLDEGRITQTIANWLMQSIEEAIDLVSQEPLCDWKGLKAYVQSPDYYKFLQHSIPQKLVTYIAVERYESACYICAAFLRAHRIARQQLHDFIGDSEVANSVINESVTEGEDARKFLEYVRITFPQVLRVVKTRQVTYSVLNNLVGYVQNLEKVGLLEEKEMIHLHDAVQTDLKKLLRNPPFVKVPKIRDWINANPLLGALPSKVRDTLVHSSKEMKLCGLTLYREESKPNGIWLISDGVVRWTSASIKNEHSLHPTFTHGSTLGLYEVLIGKSYICDMIADSVVFGFFIEAEKVLEVLRSDPVVEDFFWQESVIVVAKLLLPQIFGKMSMQDLRAHVAERSSMKICIRGETIEIPHHCIGFLLEGFVKTQGVQEELIISPAAIQPLFGDQSFRGSDMSGAKSTGVSRQASYYNVEIRPASFSHQASCYHVETRARVIMFDIPQRRPSSLLSHPDQHARSLGREHSGLMHWPEHFQKLQQHHHNTEEVEQVNYLSARAMHISIYGSMMNKTRRHTPSLPSNEVKPSRSLSYPRVPSNHGRPPVSVRSEGSTLVRNNLNMREVKGHDPEAQLKSSSTKVSPFMDYSSDESGPDEHIETIDSPSRLSFRQAP